jgi:lipopolysaccharide/colanic/teichoic acid biosynthesis glycosyltransferase
MTVGPANRTGSPGGGDLAMRVGWGSSAAGGGAAPPAGDRVVGDVEASRLTEISIRLLDLLSAVALLIVFSPLLLVVALLVRFDSPGPAIFRQRRLGLQMEPFSVAKFRTMRTGAASQAHRAHVERVIAADREGAMPMTKLAEDSRITRIGAFLRRTSIDELPQLWNVLRGEMSLVGPRPPIQYEVDRYPPEAFRRFAARPGLTGLWQVRGRSLLTFPQMIALDTEYVERRSLRLNLEIILRTPATVVHGKGAR